MDLTDGRPIADIFERNGQKELADQWDKMAGSTNPVNRNGQFGISTFTNPRDTNDQKAMISGAFDRMKQIDTFPQTLFDLVKSVYSAGYNEQGRTAIITEICSMLAADKSAFEN